MAIAVDNLANADILTHDENELENNDLTTNAALNNGATTFIKNIQSKVVLKNAIEGKKTALETSFVSPKPIGLKIEVNGVDINGDSKNSIPLNLNRRKSSTGSVGKFKQTLSEPGGLKSNEIVNYDSL